MWILQLNIHIAAWAYREKKLLGGNYEPFHRGSLKLISSSISRKYPAASRTTSAGCFPKSMPTIAGAGRGAALTAVAATAPALNPNSVRRDIVLILVFP
jgi:hypothetical protein